MSYGDVKKFGWTQLTPPWTVTHAVEIAGGRKDASTHYYPFVKVVHADGRQEEIRHWDSLLEHGDRLYIPSAAVP